MDRIVLKLIEVKLTNSVGKTNLANFNYKHTEKKKTTKRLLYIAIFTGF